MNQTKSARIQVRLTPSLKTRAAVFAAAVEGASLNSIIEEALNEYLNKWEIIVTSQASRASQATEEEV